MRIVAEKLSYNASASIKNQIKLSNYLKELNPKFSPGRHMLYSNLGFGLNKTEGIKKLIHQPDHYNFVSYKVEKYRNQYLIRTF